MDDKRKEDVQKTKDALNDLANRNTSMMKDFGNLGKQIGIIVIAAFVILVVILIVKFVM